MTYTYLYTYLHLAALFAGNGFLMRASQGE